MSPDGRFRFVHTDNGDLVLFEGSAARWKSGNSGPATATMQADGNFVLRRPDGVDVFNTGTHGHLGAYLKVEDAGFVGIYSSSELMLWSSSVKFTPTAPPGAFISGGISWRTPPSGKKAGDCVGNCGAGCGDSINPCGGPEQYWELTLKAEPTLFQSGVERTECVGGAYYVRPWEEVHAIGSFTYHGFVKDLCFQHDLLCEPKWYDPTSWALCAYWYGCGLAPGHTKTWSSPDELMRGYRYTGQFEYGGACVDTPPSTP
jgi:hypothetical protein